jgi:predicted TIM-barrel fold metal-dependent hydrolase
VADAAAFHPRGWDAHVHVFDAAAPVRTGHYRPETRTLAEAEAIGALHGIGHLVLVQPSVYGADNGVLLRALREHPGRHRGVAVVDESVADADLDALHDAGVRGVRFNMVSPVGNGDGALQALAPRLRERGWHVQWYVRPGQLPHLVELQRRSGLSFVLDHLPGSRSAPPTPACTGRRSPNWRRAAPGSSSPAGIGSAPLRPTPTWSR